MKVWVAIYEHKHGSDIQVFANEDGALKWRAEIAEEWWEHELGKRKKPDDPQQAADEYFDWVSGNTATEFFYCEEQVVQP